MVCHGSSYPGVVTIQRIVVPFHSSPWVAPSQRGYWTEMDFGSDPILHFLYAKKAQVINNL